MSHKAKLFLPLVVFLVLALSLPGCGRIASGSLQPTVTTPEQQLGFELGADYHLANYTQLMGYWKKLDDESDRMTVVDIGRTAEGRVQPMAIITSPANHRNLARYQDIARRLALAEGLTDEQARELAAEGKAVVWIDGGLHSTEVLHAQVLMEMVYQMVSRTDRETMRFLDDVILLAVLANPDGLELVADWYMREPDPKKRTSGGVPRLYQKYVGHDNNRDFYLSAQAETTNMSRVMYREWYPQIVYNHHQSGPAGTVLFAPPFRDPFNYYMDPLVPLGIDLVSAAMHRRFVSEGKPGATMRSGASYSTWWNGGLRTTPYFHNMIGLLTESIGHPTPQEIPFLPDRHLPSGDYPDPIAPQKWHFRQSIDYSITANRAVMDVASRYREDFLFNIYRMGKNSIERGSRDNWTTTPKRIAAVNTAVQKQEPPPPADARSNGRWGRQAPTKYFEMLRDPALRDARGYILPSDQSDFLTATKFVNALLKSGITVHRTTAAFQVQGKSYPAGSYVVKTAQAFRPHVLDMFEPQDYPDDIPYPGARPTPPYDSAGYTLAYQMGVEFDRILDDFNGPFETIPELLKAPRGSVTNSRGAVGFLLSHEVNDAFLATNRLLAAKTDVYWLQQEISAGGKTHPAGTIYIHAGADTLRHLEKLAADVGLTFEGVAVPPPGPALKLRPMRIGLWDQYGGSMPSGWIRWMFEHQFETQFEVVYPPALDAGGLSDRYDVLIFVGGAIPATDEAPQGRQGELPENIPGELRDRIGRVTVAKTVPQLRQFVEKGGTIIAIGSSTSIGSHLGLPLTDALVERLPNGSQRRLPPEKYYVPGSVLRASVDTSSPLAYGMKPEVDVLFSNSPVFRLGANARQSGVRPVAWFSTAEPVRSGWGWGQHYLKDAVAAVEAKIGAGRVFLFGPEITFRAQPHGTFKFLFNGIYYGGATPVMTGETTER
jgi:hypothetical protein